MQLGKAKVLAGVITRQTLASPKSHRGDPNQPTPYPPLTPRPCPTGGEPSLGVIPIPPNSPQQAPPGTSVRQDPAVVGLSLRALPSLPFGQACDFPRFPCCLAALSLARMQHLHSMSCAGRDGRASFLSIDSPKDHSASTCRTMLSTV